MNLDLLCKGEPLDVAPGVYFDMARETYDRIPAFSQTVLKKWLELGSIPSEFAFWLKTRNEEKDSERELSESLLIGSALDCFLLEREQFTAKFIEIPANAPKKPTSAQRNAKKPSAETIEAIGWWDAFERQAEGKRVINSYHISVVNRMAQNLVAKDATRDILDNCRKAVLVAEIDGYPCKGEIDLFCEAGEHLPDLKAMEDVTPDGFSKSFRKYGYNHQATFYLKLAAAADYPKSIFDFVCVKNNQPYTVKVHSFDPYDDEKHAAIYAGSWSVLSRAMRELGERLESGIWDDGLEFEKIPVASSWVDYSNYLAKEAA